MTVSARDIAKKFYRMSANYADSIRDWSNKDMWNSILEKFPYFSEYSAESRRYRGLTQLERNMQKFLKQSEFIKPYGKRPPYYELEEMWPWDPPYIQPELPPWDPIIPPDDPDRFVCDATSTSCWCHAKEKPLLITTTYPVYGVHVSFGEDLDEDKGQQVKQSKEKKKAKDDLKAGGPKNGVRVTGLQGFGTTTITGVIIGPSNEAVSPMAVIELLMRKPDGNSCSSNVNIFECPSSQCCDGGIPTCSGDNAATIARNSNTTIAVSGGSPGTWSIKISGTGFWLDQAFTKTSKSSGAGSTAIYTDGTACGHAFVSFTDECGANVVCPINSTVGVWTLQCTSCCNLEGAPTSGSNCGAGAGICRRYENFERTDDAYYEVFACSGGGGSCACEGCSTCGANVECLTHPCPGGSTKSALCCYTPGADCDPEDPGYEYKSCRAHVATYPKYYQWLCS